MTLVIVSTPSPTHRVGPTRREPLPVSGAGHKQRLALAMTCPAGGRLLTAESVLTRVRHSALHNSIGGTTQLCIVNGKT